MFVRTVLGEHIRVIKAYLYDIGKFIYIYTKMQFKTKSRDKDKQVQ